MYCSSIAKNISIVHPAWQTQITTSGVFFAILLQENHASILNQRNSKSLIHENLRSPPLFSFKTLKRSNHSIVSFYITCLNHPRCATNGNLGLI